MSQTSSLQNFSTYIKLRREYSSTWAAARGSSISGRPKSLFQSEVLRIHPHSSWRNDGRIRDSSTHTTVFASQRSHDCAGSTSSRETLAVTTRVTSREDVARRIMNSSFSFKWIVADVKKKRLSASRLDNREIRASGRWIVEDFGKNMRQYG